MEIGRMSKLFFEISLGRKVLADSPNFSFPVETLIAISQQLACSRISGCWDRQSPGVRACSIAGHSTQTTTMCANPTAVSFHVLAEVVKRCVEIRRHPVGYVLRASGLTRPFFFAYSQQLRNGLAISTNDKL